MANGEALRLLGSPDVRNAILLNEIGILLHELGKLSAEFVERGNAFPHHLVLRRLTRGSDLLVGSDANPRSALIHALHDCFPHGEEGTVVQLLVEAMEALLGDEGGWAGSGSTRLEEALSGVQSMLATDQAGAFQRVARRSRKVLSDLAWQVEGEGEVAAIEPPFIAADGFLSGLDQLPFVGDLVERQGRTWCPEELLSPEVKLFRAIHGSQEVEGTRHSSCGLERLVDVRELYCEVLANQFLEINNIRKDGPGDLGAWFWRSRLCSQSNEAMALLRRFDQGVELEGEEREAVRWLGVRAISRWAFTKILVRNPRDGRQTSLWEHCWAVSGLYKSATAQALIEGSWPQWNRLSWCILRIEVERPDPGAIELVKDLIEVEYPLGNELGRSDTGISFTFPDLDNGLLALLLDGLRGAVDGLIGMATRPHVTVDSCRRGAAGDRVPGSA